MEDLWTMKFRGHTLHFHVYDRLIESDVILIGRGWAWDGDDLAVINELDPDGFGPVRAVCPAPFPDRARVYPAPDGRWWIVLHEGGVDLYDAERVWAGTGLIRTLPLLGTWIDSSAFIVLDGPQTFVGYPDGRPDQPLPQTVSGPITPFGVVIDLRDQF